MRPSGNSVYYTNLVKKLRTLTQYGEQHLGQFKLFGIVPVADFAFLSYLAKNSAIWQ
jgi:hypothetical protein